MSYILKKWGQSAYVEFPLIKRDYVDFSGGLSFASGDVKLSLDRAAFANSTNLPTDEGYGFYSLSLTSGELGCSNLMISIQDQSSPKLFEDQALIIDTYGNTNAEHAFDLDSSSVPVSDKTGFSLLSNQNFNNSGTQNYVQILNSGSVGGSGATAAEVWAYGTRTLTDKTGFSLLANQNFSNSGDAAYYADIEFNPDDNSGKDEYTVRWYKNSNLVTTGVTGSTVTLLKRSDGTNVFTSASMTQVGSTAMYKYDATGSNRMNSNESYEVSTSATIDSAVRTWGKIIWR